MANFLFFAAACLTFLVAANGAMKQQVLYSKDLDLLPGEIVNTDPSKTPLDWVKGKVAIHGFHAEVVDSDGNSIPLTQAYVHHWVVYNQYGNAGVCGSLQYVFGGGAELRGTQYLYPEPYGYILRGDEQWMANIHIIDTRSVPNVKDCIECDCNGGSGVKLNSFERGIPERGRPGFGGGISCCPNQSRCPVDPSAEQGPRFTYRLKYTITYDDDLSDKIPIQMLVFDVTTPGGDGKSCTVEYQVPACTALPCIDVQETNITYSHDIDIISVFPHLHIGAINETLYVIRNGEKQTVCFRDPVYGTGTEPGNEDGYVVSIPGCIFVGPNATETGGPFSIKTGEHIGLRSLYDNDPTPGPLMTDSELENEIEFRNKISDRTILRGQKFIRQGVMGYAYFAAVVYDKNGNPIMTGEMGEDLLLTEDGLYSMYL